MAEPPLPNFLIIGAQRCATRWLRGNLGQHPDIFMPSYDLDFFSDIVTMRSLKMKGYRAKFDAWDGERFVGESSPSYLMHQNGPAQVAGRIDASLPDVKLIALVRDPIDRMFSSVLHHVKRGRLPEDTGLWALVEGEHPDALDLDLVGSSLYFESLRPFWKRFGERLLVLFVEDIRSDPAKVYDAALRHLGADTDFVPTTLDTVLFSNRNAVRFTGPRLTRRQARVIYMRFRRDVEELEAMTGRYMPEWDPGPPPFPVP